MGNMKAFASISISLLALTGCETDFAVTKNYHEASNHDALTAPAASPTPTRTASPSPTPSASPSPSASASPSPSPTQVCQTVLQQTAKNLRILFMIDNSASTDHSDPSQYYRIQTLRNFLQNYGSKPNLTYSFSYFGTNTYTVDPVSLSVFSSSNHPITSSDHLFGNSTFLSQALSIYEKKSAEPGTLYLTALSTLQNMILNDMAQDPKWDYVVVFLSDGGASDNHLDKNPLNKKVQDLRTMVSAHGHELTFSTVYFGAKESDVIKDPTAYYGFNVSYAEVVGNLKSMATAGNGQFLDTNLNNGSLVIGDIITVPGEVCTTN
ncbi:MAG: vWA domain-containing protein [Bdellovibrionia bacterium]